MAICSQSYGIFCLFSIQTILIISVSSPATGNHRFPQHYTMIHWADRIEKDLERTLQLITGTQQMKGRLHTSLSFCFAIVLEPPQC
ncbi:hypothetical protein DPEC_G00204920 [Dallia pectoralis]|uniref:Uncharacterized protein n=1 Tax=Dallia pectoralis TaxID=75939 RepID=A0ACC2G4E5_DALPE|nr:hypothetical protein DPEC_G00204920 [Dallia pectoralis]